jgi:hypothetical protein
MAVGREETVDLRYGRIAIHISTLKIQNRGMTELWATPLSDRKTSAQVGKGALGAVPTIFLNQTSLR